jgi:Zn-dependent protease with chaperone function
MLLGGFYLFVVAVAAGFFALPILGVLHGVLRPSWLTIGAFAVTWIPCFGLLGGLVTVRAPSLRSFGKSLTRPDAPELFAMVETLAREARTAPPAEVYLSDKPTAFVTEGGGTLGFGSKRVLCLGVPVLDALTIDELRAVVAHELGHFRGGDTSLSGLVSHTTSLFRSVLEAGERRPFAEGSQHGFIEAGLAVAGVVTQLVVSVYARIYFLLTRAMSRRQELAADAWAAWTSGPAALASALEKIEILGPAYQTYLGSDVAFALQHGAMPGDLLEGFAAFRERALPREVEAAIRDARRSEAPDPFDTHPPIVERLRALGAMKGATPSGDARHALSLLGESVQVQTWLAESSIQMFTLGNPVRIMPWGVIPERVYAPKLREGSRKLSAELHPLFPAATTIGGMFASVAKAVLSGGGSAVACRLEPALAQLAPARAADATNQVLMVVLVHLFEGAILEAGGTVLPSIGEKRLVFSLRDERVEPASIVETSMREEAAIAALRAWADRLGGEASASA